MDQLVGPSESKFSIFDKTINSITDVAAKESLKKAQECLNLLKSSLNKIDPVIQNHFEVKSVKNVDNYCSIDSINSMCVEFAVKPPTDALSFANNKPGLISLKLDVDKCKDKPETLKIWNPWLNGGDVDPKKFLRWSESILTKSVNAMKSENVDVKFCKNYPAYQITGKISGVEFTIVIVFAFKLKGTPIKGRSADYFTTVPVNSDKWTYNLSSVEDTKLNKSNRLNNTYKLMKRIRDNNKMKYVQYYWIKNLFLRVDEENSDFWNKSGGYVLYIMLKKLAECLDSKKMPSFWDKRVNLFDGVKSEQLQDGLKKINQVVKLMEDCVRENSPKHLLKSLLTPDELAKRSDIPKDELKSNSIKNQPPSIENRYKVLDKYLNEINATYNRPEDDVSLEYKNAYDDFTNSIRERIYKQHPILGAYRKIQHTGSVNDGLSIGTIIKEFDIDLLLSLPGNIATTKLASPGHVTIKLDIPTNMDATKSKDMEKWLDVNKYIVPEKFRSWIESVLTKLQTQLGHENNTIPGKNGNYKIKMSKSGPAFTMAVQKLNSGVKFDVDLVFSFEFQDPIFDVTRKGVTLKNWLAIPKTPAANVRNSSVSWRYSFPGLENQKLANLGNLKIVIKLIKRYRDVRDMPYLASYFIKTIFLWEVDLQNPKFWTNNVGFLLMYMLRKLSQALENKSIPFYWDKKLNLADRMTETQTKDAHIKIQDLITSIDKICDTNQLKNIEFLFKGKENPKL